MIKTMLVSRRYVVEQMCFVSFTSRKVCGTIISNESPWYKQYHRDHEDSVIVRTTCTATKILLDDIGTPLTSQDLRSKLSCDIYCWERKRI